VEIGADVVIFHIAIDAANRIGLPARNPAIIPPICEIMKLALQPLILFIVSHLQLEKPPVAVKALGVIPSCRVISVKVPIWYVARSTADLFKKLFTPNRVLRNPAVGWCRVVEQIPLNHIEITLCDFFTISVAVRIIP